MVQSVQTKSSVRTSSQQKGMLMLHFIYELVNQYASDADVYQTSTETVFVLRKQQPMKLQKHAVTAT